MKHLRAMPSFKVMVPSVIFNCTLYHKLIDAVVRETRTIFVNHRNANILVCETRTSVMEKVEKEL